MIILLLCTDIVAVCEKPSNAHYNSNCVYFCPFKRSNNFDIMVFNSFIHTQTHTYAFRCFIVRSICSLLFPSTCLCHGLSPRCIFTISRQYQVYCTICVRGKNSIMWMSWPSIAIVLIVRTDSRYCCIGQYRVGALLCVCVWLFALFFVSMYLPLHRFEG